MGTGDRGARAIETRAWPNLLFTRPDLPTWTQPSLLHQAAPLTNSEIALLEALDTETATPMQADSSGVGGSIEYAYGRDRTVEIGEDGDDVASAEEAAFAAANYGNAISPPPPPPALGTAVSRQPSVPLPPPMAVNSFLRLAP